MNTKKNSSDLSWEEFLTEESKKEYYTTLQHFVSQERKKTIVYPSEKNIFSAFNLTPFDTIKVVILGQDPYHGENQAHGLSFSVPKSQKKIPPSLNNIFKELETEFSGSQKVEHGNLEQWSTQGVFLLNATLTVEAQKAGSHQNKGWEIFTDTVIKKISNEKENIVFLLWGNFAQQKATLIDPEKHYILKAPHPSPLSAYRGFFGCQHFSKTNTFLKEKNLKEIEWLPQK